MSSVREAEQRLQQSEKWSTTPKPKVDYPTPTSDLGGAQLVARRLDKDGPAGVDKKTGVAHIDRLKKEAEKIAAEQAKKNAKLAAQAEDAVL